MYDAAFQNLNSQNADHSIHVWNLICDIAQDKHLDVGGDVYTYVVRELISAICLSLFIHMPLLGE